MLRAKSAAWQADNRMSLRKRDGHCSRATTTHRATGKYLNNLMTEEQQIVWYAIAAGVGILLGVAGSNV